MLKEQDTQAKQDIPANSEMLKLIEKKRAGEAHTSEEILWFINNMDQIPDYQISAWLMAVCINGLSEAETIELTRAMAYSGHVLTLKRGEKHSHDDDGDECHSIHVANSRGFVDKHSTGGVGDKVTLALTPILAALGFKVSKFSGRSLGHTGGTIDKLEAIPGFQTDITMKQFERQIEEFGIALASQSLEFAPADKRLYSLRDRTGTVESLPLIASSVMSKKIAGGADIILLDVKVGSGAFMKNIKYAKQLAKQMVDIGKALNLNTQAIISNMDQPLGFAVGNSLEVLEAIKLLEGQYNDSDDNKAQTNDFYELVLEFASSISSRIEVKDAIHSGKAYVKFEEWISAQGGSLEKFKEAHTPKYQLECRADKDAWVKELDALSVGKAVHKLAYKPSGQKDGAPDYEIDNSAGVWFKAKIGDQVKPSDILFTVYGNSEAELEIAKDEILDAYLFTESKVKKPKLVLKKLD